jgi:hypothetical protein
MSAMCNISVTMGDLLEKPYDSQENPIIALFAKGAAPGEAIGPFSLRTKVGVSKQLAIKVILLAAVACDLSDEELLAMSHRVL